MKTLANHGVISPPFRIREEWVSAAWALEPDKPISRNYSKHHPSEARDKGRSSRPKKPDRPLCEQEHEWHKSNEGKQA